MIFLKDHQLETTYDLKLFQKWLYLKMLIYNSCLNLWIVYHRYVIYAH